MQHYYQILAIMFTKCVHAYSLYIKTTKQGYK